MSPLVSVIIPCFNALTYLEDTIKSVQEQSFTDLEILLVDDQSTDGTWEYIQSIQDKQIRTFRNDRKGACAARNLGFQNSSGRYIQFLDADDLLGRDKIKHQMSLFKKFNDNIISSAIWGRFYTETSNIKWEHQIINQDYDNPIEWLIDSWNGGGMAQTAVWLTPRNLIEKAGPWNEKLLINQDGEFFSRVLLQASKIIFSNESFVFYRSENENSISRSKKTFEKAASLLASYELYEQNVSEHLSNSQVKKALGNNYLGFMYQYHVLFPELSNRAKINFNSLGLRKTISRIGSKKMQLLSKILGFEKALYIKRLLSSK